MSFRWSTKSEQPQLFDREQRIVGSGAYRGLTFHEIEARSILNRVPRGPMPFEWTINAYRGCSHACVYCLARATHDYLGFGIGEDFDTQIVVKINAVELVAHETQPGRWAGHSIAMGTNTDPYQRAEGKYKLTRGILEVLVERGNPFSILTKSPLILRDLDLLVEGSTRAPVTVGLSIGSFDEAVWRLAEPGTPHPRRRLAAVKRLADAGLETYVLVAPVLPGLSDEGVDAVVQACVAAGAAHVTPVRLHLRDGVRQHYLRWLAQMRPELVGMYEAVYRTPPSLRSTPQRASVASSSQLGLGI